MFVVDAAAIWFGILGLRPWRFKKPQSPDKRYSFYTSQDGKDGPWCLVVKKHFEGPWPKEILDYEYNSHRVSKPYSDRDKRIIRNHPTFWPYKLEDDTTDEQLYEWVAEIKAKISEWESYKPAHERAKVLLDATN